MDKSELPTFLELAANRLAWANRGDKTINIKIAINTARMMAVAEAAERDRLREVNAELVKALTAIESQAINLTAPAKPVRDRAIHDIKRWAIAALAKAGEK